MTVRAKTESNERRVYVNELVTLLIQDSWIIVIVDEQPVMRYSPTDSQTRNSVVVQLVAAQLVTVKEAVQAFGIARSTLTDALHNFKQQGIRGLIPNKRGPKQAWKLVPNVRRLILDAVYAYPDWNMSQITELVNQRLLAEQLQPVSERHLRRFLTFCGILPRTTKTRLTSDFDPEPASSLDLNQTQVASDRKPPIIQSKINVRLDEQAQLPANKYLGGKNSHLKGAQTVLDRRYLLRLENGLDSAFAGGFLLIHFLTLVQFAQLIEKELADLREGYISTLQMALTFFYLALFGIASLEMVEMVVKTELGVLIGRARSPGLTKLRAFLKEVAQRAETEAFALAAAAAQIRAGIVEWEVLFIDGHFIPYYGRRSIRKGYFTTHRMAIKGNQAYYANDKKGRPLFFLLVEASTSLTSILPKMVMRVQQIVGQQWTKWCLTVIFDRGGFSAQLFAKLDQEKVYWVTWWKGPRQVWDQIASIKEECFKLYLLRLKKSQVVVKLVESQVDITDYGKSRAIILLDPKSKKRMVIISNDKKRSIKEIAELLLNRWSQENFFKVMLARYFMDYTPSYQFEQVKEEPLIDNPKIKELRRLKNRLMTMKRKLESELSKKLLARKRDQVSLKKYKEAHQKRVRAIGGIGREIERIKEELAQTPKQIPLSQAWGKKVEVANLESKRFFDVIKILAFNSEEWLQEQLSLHYEGNNIRQVLLQIIFRGGYVQLVDGVLQVRLKPFDSPKVQAAAEALCLELNKNEICTLDKFQFPIVYEVLPRS